MENYDISGYEDLKVKDIIEDSKSNIYAIQFEDDGIIAATESLPGVLEELDVFELDKKDKRIFNKLSRKLKRRNRK